VPFWWHSIDLGDGVVTPGRRAIEDMNRKFEVCRVPDLTDKTVLDIGAWDGYFSFEAERRGARRVVALDKYVWSLDLANAPAYVSRFKAAGHAVGDFRRIPGYYRPDGFPTKAGFDTAHRILGSRVEHIVDDFATVDLARLGSFDVVFYLGGLYHMEDPLAILRRLALVTRELAIVETAGIDIAGHENRSLFEFYEADELHGDGSNWWAPNATGLAAMCRAAGFRSAMTVERSGMTDCGNGLRRCRLFLHASHTQDVEKRADEPLTRAGRQARVPG